MKSRRSGSTTGLKRTYCLPIQWLIPPYDGSGTVLKPCSLKLLRTNENPHIPFFQFFKFFLTNILIIIIR